MERRTQAGHGRELADLRIDLIVHARLTVFSVSRRAVRWQRFTRWSQRHVKEMRRLGSVTSRAKPNCRDASGRETPRRVCAQRHRLSIEPIALNRETEQRRKEWISREQPRLEIIGAHKRPLGDDPEAASVSFPAECPATANGLFLPRPATEGSRTNARRDIAHRHCCLETREP